MSGYVMLHDNTRHSLTLPSWHINEITREADCRGNAVVLQ
jgi:hypothetical protein